MALEAMAPVAYAPQRLGGRGAIGVAPERGRDVCSGISRQPELGDISGDRIDAERVSVARREDMEYFEKIEVLER